jgi:roadblock/LC7 domain-containing protein
VIARPLCIYIDLAATLAACQVQTDQYGRTAVSSPPLGQLVSDSVNATMGDPASLERVPDDVVVGAVKAFARTSAEGGMMAASRQISKCMQDAEGGLSVKQLQFCFAYDVLASNIAAGHARRTGMQLVPGMSWSEASHRFALYMAKLGVPVQAQQGMVDDLTKRTAAEFVHTPLG